MATMGDISAAASRNMRVLVAPCSFKGSLSASEAAAAMARGCARAGLCVDENPLADGGEGTADALIRAVGGRIGVVEVRDPLGRRRTGRLAALADGAFVVECAEAVGLGLLAARERDPRRATSFGVGDLLVAALDQGARRVLVALGGSGTADGGLGLLLALGARVTDADGHDISTPADLARVTSVDLTEPARRLAGRSIVALCDVLGPLGGPRGARLYMPQKGASPEDVDRLGAGLDRLGEALGRATGHQVAHLAGAGAAGGLGVALAALGAELVSGADHVLEAAGIPEALRGAALALTGEGRIDQQTGEGKAIAALAARCRVASVPLVALCGAREGDLAALHAAGVDAIFPICPGPIDAATAHAEAAALVERAAEQVARLVARTSGCAARPL